MASGLRQELRATLSVLQTQIHADSQQGVEMHRAQAHLAELSGVRALLTLCLRALTGEKLLPDDSFLSHGAAMDRHDATSFAARELFLLREDVEQQLDELKLKADLELGGATEQTLRAVLEAESHATQVTESNERQHATMMIQATCTCSREMCELLCMALAAAAPPGTGTAQRRAIAAQGTVAIQDTVARWLRWFARAEPEKTKPVAVLLPPLMTALNCGDEDASAYIRLIRQCMHLRRQHARLLGALQRIACAVRVGDACALLEAKIVLPPGGSNARN